ncbi:MAG: penicillin acylase family protein [Longimicrobiales bacterium]
MTRIRRLLPLIAALATTACAQVNRVVEGLFRSPAERLATEVTIRRDEWGVPHIHGATDAAVVFGLGYAQAEDDFPQLEEDVIRAIGRSAELYGEEALPADLVKAAFEVERLSREEYEREPPERQRVWDAFALGINYYLETHPETRPRLLSRFEPWFVFALLRTVAAGTVIDGVRLGDVSATPIDGEAVGVGFQQVGTFDPALLEASGRGPDRAAGANAWAVAPSRSASGHALLLLSPHASFFGGGQRYEVHLRSDEGWHFSGFALLATPVPRSGHNERLGWSHTSSSADLGDVWIVTFDHATDSLAYRYGDGWRQAVEWEDTVRVRVDSTVVARQFRFRKTHHGPVVAAEGDRAYAVRTPRFEEGGSIQQWYAMGHATSLDEFLAALGTTMLPASNTMYADGAGNILYVHGNAVPRRDPDFDWSRPVDGAAPATEWQGYHALDELPQLLNPPSGWLQNASSTPFLATAEGDNLDPDAFPSYMARETDNVRARVSRAILSGDSAWTFEEWARAAFDRRVIEAAELIPTLVDEWERLGAVDPDRALRLDFVIASLRLWDGVSTIESVPMTHFLLWLERMRGLDAEPGEWPRMQALEAVLAELEADWGTTNVPWGEINRLQRTRATGSTPVDPEAAGLPIAGAPGWAGIVFDFRTPPGPAGKLRFGTSGHAPVGIVEFAPRPRTRTIAVFGQSADPDSPHYFDQAQLYARGELKDAWFQPEDVERAARQTYAPGEPPRANGNERNHR